MGIYEKATRMKLRFPSVVGNLSVEDLWDLPLVNSKGVCLDDIAKAVNKELKQQQEESFVIKKENKMRKELQLKLDILKHIIKIKLDEEKAREEESLKRAEKEKILKIIQMKEEKELMEMDLDELKSMVKDL